MTTANEAPSGGLIERKTVLLLIDEWLRQYGDFQPSVITARKWATDALKDLRDHVAALSAPPPAVAPQGWQDIGSAPKDGSWVDIWATKPVVLNEKETITGWRMAYCRWKEPGPFWDGGWDGVHQGWTATHWQRPPKGPDETIRTHVVAVFDNNGDAVNAGYYGPYTSVAPEALPTAPEKSNG